MYRACVGIAKTALQFWASPTPHRPSRDIALYRWHVVSTLWDRGAIAMRICALGGKRERLELSYFVPCCVGRSGKKDKQTTPGYWQLLPADQQCYAVNGSREVCVTCAREMRKKIAAAKAAKVAPAAIATDIKEVAAVPVESKQAAVLDASVSPARGGASGCSIQFRLDFSVS